MSADRIRFTVLFTLQVLSFPCFIYLFYQFRHQAQLRQSHHHHVIILLLVVSFLFILIPVPLSLAFMFTSTVIPASPHFCSFWNWIHYSLNIINLYLMGFASAERNWLIFHPHIVRTRRAKIAIHYIPLAFCLLFPAAIYAGAIFIFPCRIRYSYSQLFCRFPCYFSNRHWYNFDLFVMNYFPLVVIPVCCAMIYIRVLFQKRTMKQHVFKWKRDKKMILQLWAISSLYLGMWGPMQICGLINLYWDPRFMLQAQFDYMYLFPYFIHFIYPYIVLLTYHHEMIGKRQQTSVQAVTS